MTQLVVTPPRAAETNEPVSLVGGVVPAVEGADGAEARGRAGTFGSSGSSSALNAHAPVAAAPALARSVARRFGSVRA